MEKRGAVGQENICYAGVAWMCVCALWLWRISMIASFRQNTRWKQGEAQNDWSEKWKSSEEYSRIQEIIWKYGSLPKNACPGWVSQQQNDELEFPE